MEDIKLIPQTILIAVLEFGKFSKSHLQEIRSLYLSTGDKSEMGKLILDKLDRKILEAVA